MSEITGEKQFSAAPIHGAPKNNLIKRLVHPFAAIHNSQINPKKLLKFVSSTSTVGVEILLATCIKSKVKIFFLATNAQF